MSNNPSGVNQNGVGPVFWTEQRVAELCKRWNAGDSGSIIAAAMGTTRNTILGKATRLKLRSRAVLNRAQKNSLPTLKRPQPSVCKPYKPGTKCATSWGAYSVDTKPVPFTPRVSNVASLRKTILDLGPYGVECRWPDSEQNSDGLNTFCGRQVDCGPYCQAHRAIAFTPRKVNRRVEALAA